MYEPGTYDTPAHGAAGRLIKRLGPWAYLLFFVVPLAFVSIVFAIVPLGDPQKPQMRNQWVFIFISNIAVSAAFAYLYNAAFLNLADDERPFRTSIIPIIAVVLSQLALMNAVLLTNGVFDFLGGVALAIIFIVLFFSMIFAYWDRRDLVISFFARFMLLLILYIPFLVGFVIAYRETESLVQSLISFAFAFLTFVYRRIMLSRLDPFPLDASQLLSGFWVQNLSDCVTILAFPQVKKPGVYAAIFLSNAAQNVAFLGFVSNMWIYKLRPALKTYVLNALKCNFPIPPIPEPDESFDPINRGHDANVGGYRRRQFRFYFFRMLSQAVAMTMYLGISPILRYGTNSEYNPLGTSIGGEDYRNSMIYAAVNLVFVIVVALLGYWYLNKRHHQTYHEIREIHKHDLLNHNWVGLVTAIMTHNLIFTIAIILSHYCVFSSFKECRAELL